MKLLFLSLFIALLLNSCEFYESKVPISNSLKSAIDTTLIGFWEVKQNSEEELAIVHIDNFNEYAYLITHIDFVNDSTGFNIKEFLNFKMYNSNIKGNKYFNLKGIGAANFDKDFYFFMKYKKMHSDTLEIFLLNEEFRNQYSTSSAFSEYITNNIDSFNLYFKPWGNLNRINNIEEFIKVKKE